MSESESTREMQAVGRRTLLLRAGADLALLMAFGVFMGFLGPFGTIETPAALRFPYWLICIVGGGLIGIALDEAVGSRLAVGWRLAADTILMTPLVTLLVYVVSSTLMDSRLAPHDVVELAFNVFIICVPIMALRILVWRPPVIVAVPPPPASDAAFRKRLSAKKREARLIAVEAEDHYLRVHTDAGDELVTARFADALKDLADAKGFRIHRSWWVAADALEGVRWRKGGGEARLAGGLVAPVSRTYAPELKAAGWF